MKANQEHEYDQSGKTAVPGQGKMYYLRPQYELPEPFPEIKTNMYTLRSAASPSTTLLNGHADEGPTDAQGRFRVQESRSTISDFQNISEAKVLEIEARQQVMLGKLSQLKDMIESIYTKYAAETEQNRAFGSSANSRSRLDLVVSADPRKPPYSILFMFKVLRQNFGSIKFQSHVHSSVQSNLAKHLNIFNHLEDLSQSDSADTLCLILIWKNMEYGVELLVDPSNEGPIRGESNIARFLSRLLPVTSPLNYDSLDWETLLKADGLLELANESDAVSLALIEGQLLNQERRGPFLFGQVTIADFVLFSSMGHQCESNPNKFNNSPGILRWLKDCQLYGGFELFMFY